VPFEIRTFELLTALFFYFLSGGKINKIMDDKLISLEVAKLAKEAGFDYCVDNHYSQEDCVGDEFHTFMDDVKNSEIEHFEYSAPTQSLLQKWVREMHLIDVFVEPVGGGLYGFLINDKLDPVNWVRLQKQHKTYEDALDQGLKIALRKIKEKLSL